jgi:hypothetical protein
MYVLVVEEISAGLPEERTSEDSEEGMEVTLVDVVLGFGDAMAMQTCPEEEGPDTCFDSFSLSDTAPQRILSINYNTSRAPLTSTASHPLWEQTCPGK